jgi:LysR family transcriptional activator of nhaA
MLLPTERTALRRYLDQWFDSVGSHPRIVAEFDDSALMTAFGAAGDGLFPAPSVVEHDILAKHEVELVHHIGQIQQRFYAISVERKIKNPAVQAICEAARQSVFS